MLRRQAYKFRLRAKPAQEARFRRFAGAKWLTAWRNSPEFAFLKEAPVHALQEALKSLDDAFKRFFKKDGGYPRFKRKGLDGYRETDVACFALDQAHARVKLPKIGWVRYRQSQIIEGAPKNISLSRDSKGWHVAVQVEIDAPLLAGGAGIVGIDRGITHFMATSQGDLFAPLNAHRTALHRLRKYQRACSRRMEAAKVKAGVAKDKPFPKGFRLAKSNRLKRAEACVQRQHAKVARVRQDWLHKQSHLLASQNAIVVMEDLKIRNMSASAAGDDDEPGTNVRAKSGLNRSILDQGWYEFARQVDYKTAWRGGHLIKVPAKNTSRKCSCCGFTDAGQSQERGFQVPGLRV